MLQKARLASLTRPRQYDRRKTVKAVEDFLAQGSLDPHADIIRCNRIIVMSFLYNVLAQPSAKQIQIIAIHAAVHEGHQCSLGNRALFHSTMV
jgi:hypothetical protein